MSKAQKTKVKKRIHRFKYDRYTVKIPSDAADTMQDLGMMAITEAEERSKLWCSDQAWSAEPVGGPFSEFPADWPNTITFRVVRKRPANAIHA